MWEKGETNASAFEYDDEKEMKLTFNDNFKCIFSVFCHWTVITTINLTLFRKIIEFNYHHFIPYHRFFVFVIFLTFFETIGGDGEDY